ncbi:MAG: hypothetical protein CK424_05310 [Legionella sp.]|nr:MAG: hypothetical protein CK424_05310 [Legionella sp.]
MINQQEYSKHIAIFDHLAHVFEAETFEFNEDSFQQNKNNFNDKLNTLGYKKPAQKIALFNKIFEGFEWFNVYAKIQKDLNLNISASPSNPYGFFQAIFNSNTSSKPIGLSTINDILQLIALQKKGYVKNTTIAPKKTETKTETKTEQLDTALTTHPRTRFQTYAPYIKPSAMILTGSGLAVFGGLLQFNAKFALLVGLHLHPALLAALVVGGLMMAGHGVYRAMKTYQANTPPATGQLGTTTPTCYHALLQRFGNFGVMREERVAVQMSHEAPVTQTMSRNT